MRTQQRPLINYLTWTAVLCVAAVLAVYIRLYPLRAHIWSSTHEEATMLVIMNIKKNLAEKILRESPQMLPQEALRLANQGLNQTLHDQQSQVRRAIDQVNTQMVKNSPNAQPLFLLESDPYYFYNLTENIVTSGQMADVTKGSKYFNPLMGAPFGFWQPFSIHPYIGFLVYKACGLFSPDIPLMNAVAFVPLVICVFTLAALAWVCRLFGCGPFSFLGAAVIFTLAPIYLKRSALGWYDTDPYNLFFPLVLLGTLLWGLQPKPIKRTVMTSLLLALITCLYALFWQGWGFMFFLTLCTLATVAVWAQWIIKDTHLRNQNLVLLLGTAGGSVLGISLIFGPQEFFILCKEGLGELLKFTDKALNLWPNLFIGVGELKKSSGKGFLEAVGGWMILGLGSCGFILTTLTACRNIRERKLVFLVVLNVFLAATLLLAVSAERFALFTLVPLSIFCALSLQIIGSKIPRVPSSLGLVLLLVFSALKGEQNVATVITPIFNSAWQEALTTLNTQTPADSIINTWWPPGHFIKAIAKRRVPFDGASLSEGEIGYWMSNIFLSIDETHARGLVRMLNLSGNTPAQYLTDGCGLKLSTAVSLLHAVALKDRPGAEAFLKPFLKPGQIEHLLTLTHGGTPHSYLLLYNEMVDDNLIFKFTGGWDIAKVEAINDNPAIARAVPARNSASYIDFLWSIAGGPNKYSEALAFNGQNGQNLAFKEGISIDLTTMDAVVDSEKFGHGKPLSVVFAQDGRIKEHLIAQGNLNYSVVLYKEDGQYTARLMDRALANSLLIKLYFLDGQGLRFFKPLGKTQDLTGRTRIKTFEVLWNN